MGVKYKANGKDVNLAELLNKFEKLPANVMANALKAGVRAAATEVKKEAQLLAPRKSGKLRKSISVKLRRTNSKAVIRFSVAAGVFYAFFIEYGASPHLITLRNKKLLSAKGADYGTEVQHPGISPRPFMRPALDNKEAQIIPIIASKIAERLDKLAQGGE